MTVTVIDTNLVCVCVNYSFYLVLYQFSRPLGAHATSVSVYMNQEEIELRNSSLWFKLGI